ncbi:hypothetical protein EDD11_009480 [Mortierella claussenii]|nr:hypothetical protein EDD11_009480 [Mortierella claussenii]
MSRLSLNELNRSKLINQQFHSLANVDQLWRRLTLEAHIDHSIMERAKESCINKKLSWQQLLRTATLMERENQRVMKGSIDQMAEKIHQVREALERQTQALEDTHTRLSQLSDRLTQMEQRSRLRELERERVRQRDIQQQEDEQWMKKWEKMLISAHSSNSSSSSSNSHSTNKNRRSTDLSRDSEAEGQDGDLQGAVPATARLPDPRLLDRQRRGGAGR